MLKLENTEVLGWEAAIRGMRNPMNSWEKSDSGAPDCKTQDCAMCPSRIDTFSGGVYQCTEHDYDFYIGQNDHDLMMRLANGGPVHAKYRRMITVYVDILAPLYWWKEFDTYKVGTVANSCSTMHKIAEKEFTLDDFSCEHLMEWSDYEDEAKQFSPDRLCNFKFYMMDTIVALNNARELYLSADNKLKRSDLTESERKHITAQKKRFWWQMIQLLPTSYNQRRTVMLNYEVLHNIYISRKDHRLDEWRDLCKWIESLPYSELITGKE